MKNRFIKGIAFTLAIVMVLFAGVGCSPKESAGADKAPTSQDAATTDSTSEDAADSVDTSEFVTITMYLLGSTSDAYEAAVAKLNEKAKEDLNCELQVKFIGWGEFTTKYPLLLSGGEPFDLIYTANWLGFANEAAKGAFMPLEELLPKYAPKSFETMNEEAINSATVDGHLYALTPNFSQYATSGYVVRGDLMKKYDMTAIQSMDDFGTFLGNVVKNDPQFDPTGFDSMNNLGIYQPQYMGLYNLTNLKNFPLMVEPLDESGTVVNYIDDPRMEEFYGKMKEWADAGYWGKNVLANKDSSMLEKGLAASKLTNFDVWVSTYRAKPEWDLQFYPAYPNAFLTSYVQDAMSIPISSKNPERALMLLEKIRNDESYYNLLTYGIEGVNYNITEDGELEVIDPSTFGAEAYCMQGFKDENFVKTIVGSPQNMNAVKQAAKETGIATPFVDFSFNVETVKNEVAAIQNVMIQYECPLSLGYIDDPKAGLQTLKEKLQAAGIEVVQEELQKQVTAFLESKNK